MCPFVWLIVVGRSPVALVAVAHKISLIKKVASGQLNYGGIINYLTVYSVCTKDAIKFAFDLIVIMMRDE